MILTGSEDYNIDQTNNTKPIPFTQIKNDFKTTINKNLQSSAYFSVKYEIKDYETPISII
jgi:hypothetical protein